MQIDETCVDEVEQIMHCCELFCAGNGFSWEEGVCCIAGMSCTC